MIHPEPKPTPEPESESEYPSSPQTGDTTNLHLWIALLFVSGGGIFGTTLYGRKRKDEN
ncbi:MAG: LPXTG cell wall anchor domain-containing protein [bacterium]|nr:LPXTG cell wall anchor domain-containing protein [bacterium]